MNAKVGIGAVGIVMAALFVAWLLYPGRSTGPISRAPQSGSKSSEIAPRSMPGKVASPGRRFVPTFEAGGRLRDEARTATDLKALFDRYSAMPDPTGEISFALAQIANECFEFTGKALHAQLDYLNQTVTQNNPDHQRRTNEVARRIDRCRGFESIEARGEPHRTIAFMGLINGLYQKSKEAGYPGAFARELTFPAMRKAIPDPDQRAIELLSGPVNADVLDNVRSYLVQRNGFGGEDNVSITAWTLLSCDFGAECGKDSRLLYRPCILEGRCGFTSVEDSLKTDVGQEVMRAAYVLRIKLQDAIRNQEWETLGLTGKRPKISPPLNIK